MSSISITYDTNSEVTEHARNPYSVDAASTIIPL